MSSLVFPPEKDTGPIFRANGLDIHSSHPPPSPSPLTISARCVRSPTPASGQPPDSKVVWIFTNQDDPCRGSDAQRTRVNMLKRDCQEAGVAIHVLPLPKRPSSSSSSSSSGSEVGGSSFDGTIFYNDLVTAPNDDGEGSTMKTSPEDDDRNDVDDGKMQAPGVVDIEEILDRFVIGTRKRRKYATLPLLLPGWWGRWGPGDGGDDDAGDDRPGIMLDLYSVVQVRNKPQKVSVHQENNK